MHKLIDHRCFTHPKSTQIQQKHFPFPKAAHPVWVKHCRHARKRQAAFVFGHFWVLNQPSDREGNGREEAPPPQPGSDGWVPTAASSLLTPLARQTLTGKIALCNRSPAEALNSIPVGTREGKFIQVGMRICRAACFCFCFFKKKKKQNKKRKWWNC